MAYRDVALAALSREQRVEISTGFARLCMTASARQTPLPSRFEAKSGGAEEARTPDLQSAILALSQLSYCPILLQKRVRDSCRVSGNT